MIPFMFVSKYLNHDLRIEVSWDIWDGIRKAMRSHPWKSAEAYRAYQRVYGRKNPFDGGGLSQATYTEMYGLYREQTQVIHYYMRYLNLKDLEPHSWLYRENNHLCWSFSHSFSHSTNAVANSTFCLQGPEPSCHQHQHQHPSVHFPIRKHSACPVSLTPITRWKKMFSSQPKKNHPEKTLWTITPTATSKNLDFKLLVSRGIVEWVGGGLATTIEDSRILLVQIVPEHRNGLAANVAVGNPLIFGRKMCYPRYPAW